MSDTLVATPNPEDPPPVVFMMLTTGTTTGTTTTLPYVQWFNPGWVRHG